ncbi:radical SAM protein [Lysobacter enzymogenes]|uniref:Radical SAM protein n=1 Tax=Lysobacter enzymogenes TaxID=69 RepID=A0A3N2RFK0_LYSEN|nr:radical SAM protein [Lysobacter enzymogenes]ROU06240.1 radical SAM protein [Lysobacter enzymogenes]
MQPQSSAALDRHAFERLKQSIRNKAESSRGLRRDPGYATAIPEEIGIKLNNRCNLRCTHCFEWNEDGYHHDMIHSTVRDEVPIELLRSVLEQTRGASSKLFLWGGEPLIYSQFGKMAELIAAESRWTTICTNAITTERRYDDLVKMSANLEFLASLEGFEQENDAIRGKGTYAKVIKSVDLLLDSKRRGEYRGEVAVQLTINDSMIGRLYEFVEHFERVGVDSVHLTFPWYISGQTAGEMDRYVGEHFPWAMPKLDFLKPSWHSFTYSLSEEHHRALADEMARVSARVWNTRVRFKPALEDDELLDFIRGSSRPGQRRSQCLAITNRIDILPNGDVSSCKFFPEFSMGNLKDASLQEVWHGERFGEVRKTLACGLMPACSKCVLLYLNGR